MRRRFAPALADELFLLGVARAIVRVLFSDGEPHHALVVAKAPGVSNELPGWAERTKPLVIKIIRHARRSRGGHRGFELRDLLRREVTQHNLEAIAAEIARLHARLACPTCRTCTAGCFKLAGGPLQTVKYCVVCGVFIF